MALKILHTSDLHLGMKFAGYPAIQEKLIQARFEVLERLVERANKEKCDLFIIAGDLFDRSSVAQKDIRTAAVALSAFEGKLIAVLPGNHDYITQGADDLWKKFRAMPEAHNVLLLDEQKQYDLETYDINAVLYACPCTSKHSEVNALGWISGEAGENTEKSRIGIAHGSLEGVSPDFDGRYYPMNRLELEKYSLDLWLLGHTHISYPANPGSFDRIFFAGTPEPDGFDCSHGGHAWIIEIDDEQKIHPILLDTGACRFCHEEVSVEASEDVAALLKKYSGSGYAQQLLKLKLSGRVTKDVVAEIAALMPELETLFLYLEVDRSGLAEEITLERIQQEFTTGSLPHQLLSAFVQDPDDYEALQTTYELLQEVKK